MKESIPLVEIPYDAAIENANFATDEAILELTDVYDLVREEADYWPEDHFIFIRLPE